MLNNTPHSVALAIALELSKLGKNSLAFWIEQLNLFPTVPDKSTHKKQNEVFNSVMEAQLLLGMCDSILTYQNREGDLLRKMRPPRKLLCNLFEPLTTLTCEEVKKKATHRLVPVLVAALF